jgi:HTH-type transcriptional regulator/antitoxin HigA
MLKPVKTKRDYEAALQRCYELMQKDVKANTKIADELEVLSILVKNYEEKHYPVPPPHPVEAIRFRLEQSGLDEKELNKILGGYGLTDFLTYRTFLTLLLHRHQHGYLPVTIRFFQHTKLL